VARVAQQVTVLLAKTLDIDRGTYAVAGIRGQLRYTTAHSAQRPADGKDQRHAAIMRPRRTKV
jgi:hypothetical protein